MGEMKKLKKFVGAYGGGAMAFANALPTWEVGWATGFITLLNWFIDHPWLLRWGSSQPERAD